MHECIFCGECAEVDENTEFQRSEYIVRCPNCKDYTITKHAFKYFPILFETKYKDKKHLISGYLREMNELGVKVGLIKGENIEQYFNNGFIPTNPLEKADKILKYLFQKTTFFGEVINIDTNICAIAYAVKSEEFSKLLELLCSMGYIKTRPNSGGYFREARGYTRVQELESKNKYSKQAFVAMWFDNELKNVYSNFIFKAINETGFKPVRIDGIEHINKICDEIIAEIKRSRFIIADFTGQRGGVYYEAGFAHGLGIPVIWTCRKDDAKDLHFDIRQYNCIIWETGEDLYEKLKNRIEAVII